MTPMFNDPPDDPFLPEVPGNENCHGNDCPTADPVSNTFCGSVINPTDPDFDACDSCDIDNTFLNCYIAGFSGKLGLGANESSVTIDLIEKKTSPCPSSSPCVSGAPVCEGVGSEYNGQLGHIYTFQVGSFCFRGILTNHNYTEGESGYRYKVVLGGDGRACLSNVNVILGGFYSDIPSELKPNLINAIYELEKSVGDDTCGSGNRCTDFMLSGVSDKGILIKKALQAIDAKLCQVPVSNACLIIDVSKIIAIAPSYYRIASTESTALEIIDSACKEAGYDFFTRIVGNTIEVIPVNKKAVATEHLLFDFMQTLSGDNQVSNREYGQELSYEKSKKLIFGDNIHYLVEVKDTGSGVPVPLADTTVSCIAPGYYEYNRFNYSVNSGPGTGDTMPKGIGVDMVEILGLQCTNP